MIPENKLMLPRAGLLNMISKLEIRMFNNQMAPKASSVGFSYNSFVPGQERKVVDKLTIWDKFVMSDGIVPSVAKFSIAILIVGATVFSAEKAGTSDLTIYNGLGTAVHVDVGHSSINVPLRSSHPTLLMLLQI